MPSERYARACPGWDPSQPIGRQGPAHGERECDGGPHPCSPLSSGTLCLWQSEFPPQAFPGTDFLPPSPQAVSLQPAAILSQLCCLTCMFQLSAPVRTGGDISHSGVHRAVAPAVCEGLCPSATGQLFPPSPHLRCSTCVCCCPVS